MGFIAHRGFESLSLRHYPLQINKLQRLSCATPQSQSDGFYLNTGFILYAAIRNSGVFRYSYMLSNTEGPVWTWISD